MRLVLEPRFLFDGSVHAVTKHAATLADHVDTQHAAPQAEVHAAALHPTDIPAVEPRPHADQIVFIDTSVTDWQALARGAKSDVQVVLIDPGKDGFKQVTAALQGRYDLKAIQFVTDGRTGEVELGNSAVTTASLLSHKAAVAAWGDHLAQNGSIEFYGCNVGQGSAGLAFVNAVHTLTGAQVGASTDATGAAALGGDWTLERTTGHLNVGVPFTAATLAHYSGVLDSPVPTVTLTAGTGSLTGDTTGDVLLGDTFTETVTFTNTATTGAGYGPIINLFVPTKTTTDTETATLQTADYLGSSLDLTHKFTLVQDPGDSSKVGALNPFVLNSSGQPTFIDAPSGFKVGDTMYALVLPFGSFTAGEPTAAVTLHFTADASSEVTAHSGDSINIAAVGAFEFGSDALNNPASDPSILGTAVSSSTTVSLVHVEATTNLHEGETATGPDNPFDYVLTITPAPAVSTDAIHNLDITFQLPDQVEHTGGSGTITATGGGSATFNPQPGGILQGGSVTIDYASLTAASTITVPVFVPKTDASGSVILTPGNHYNNTIDDTEPYSYSGKWTPVLGLAVADGQETIVNSSETPVSFVAKALAIQVHDTAGGSAGGDGSIIPGHTYTETIDFQVSDYVNLNNLVITDVIGDGLTLTPGSATTLIVDNATGANPTTTGSFGTVTSTTGTVNGQTVVVSGTGTDTDSNTVMTYSRNDVTGDGTTTVNFMVGALLADSVTGAVAGTNLASVLQGGSASTKTQGSITFSVTALDKYTETNSGKSLREKDFVTNQVVSSGTSETTADVVNTAAPETVLGTTSDTSGLQDDVPDNSLALAVVDVNGTASDGSSGIAAGDTVTYQLTYTMPAGTDYGNLNLSSFLPLPIFSTLDPTATGGSEAFVAGTGLAAGTYKLVSGPSGAAISGVTADGVANSLSFSLGTHDDTTNTAGTVVIQFSVKATNTPFADGLFLANLANSQNFNAHDSVNAITANAIQQIKLSQPELVTKTGVVSVVGDDGTTTKGSYTVDPNDTGDDFTWPTQNTDPSGGFKAAGSSGNPLLTNPLNGDDLNVTGTDGSDTVRVVTTVENTGSGTAFNVELKGAALPTGATVADVKVYDANGNQISTADITDLNGNALGTASARTNAYFSNGIEISDPSGLAHNGVYYVVYDMKLSPTQSAGATLTTTGTLVNWWNTAAGNTADNGFVTGATAVGVSADALTDNATIGTSAPTVTKTLTSTSYAGTTGSNVALGEQATYTLTLTIPEGQITNNGGSVLLKDALPAGMTFDDITSITYSSGVTSTTVPTVGALSGTSLSLNFGSSITNANADTPGTITITYTATVTATVTPSDGATHTNNATLTYDGKAVAAGHVTVTEVDPNVGETISVKDDGTGNAVTNIYSGETLDYTVKLTNSGDSIANDATYYVEIPTADLHGITALNGPAGTTITDVGTQTVGGITYEVLKLTDPALAAGASDSFTFQAVVNNDLAAGTQVKVQTPNDNSLTPGNTTPSGAYYSLPSSDGHQYSGSKSNTVSVATFSPTLQIIGESNNTNGTGTGLFDGVSSADGTIGDIIRYSAYVQVPEGSNDTQLVVTLPPGMTFQDIANDTITVALVSPTGQLTSTNVGAGGQQSYTGTFDPGAATATFALNGSNVHVSGNTITFDLGTLTDNESSAKPNYAIVQFNAIVANSAGNQSGGTLAANVAVGTQTSANATVTLEEPSVSLTKTVQSVVNNPNGTATIVFTETITNNGNASAYNVSLDDPEAGGNVGNISGLTGTGSLSVSGNGTHDVTATGTLAAGATETITYTETVTDRTQAVADATATVTYTSLQHATETLTGTSTGATGTGTGTRDGSGGVNDYSAQATVGFGVVSGKVWNDIGPDNTQFGETGSHDTGLSGVTVTGLFGAGGEGGTSGVTETTTTDANGNYSMLVIEGGGTIAVPASGSGGVAANETQVYNDGSTVGTPVSVTASTSTVQSNVNFSFQTPDTAPVIAGWGNGSVTGSTPSVTYTEGAGAVTLSSGGSVTDTQIDETNHDYDGSKLIIQRYDSSGNPAPNGSDVFVGTGSLSLSGGTVEYGGTAVGSYTEVNGVLTVTFAGTTSAATVNNVLNAVGYQGTDTGTIAAGIKIGATLDDHNSSSQQGTGGDMTSAPVFVTLSEIPGAGSATFTEPNNADPSTVAVALDPTLNITGTDTYNSATVSISGNHGEDVLTFTNDGSTMGDIVGTYSNGVLTLTSSTGATATQMQNALRAVQYYDSSDTPITTSRTITFSVDGVTNGTTTAAVTSLDVVATNDSPVLSGVGSLNHPTEDSGPPVAGSTGTSVSTLVGSGNITDPDGAGAHDGSNPGTPGIAITSADTSKGNWYYSLDGGTTWVEFAGSGMTAISDTHALNLAANAQIYFEPTVVNENGDVPNALTFRAWDKFDGATNGGFTDLSGLTLGSGNNTAGSAYSSATETVGLHIDAVNDAPIAAGGTTLISTPEDTSNPPGDTVANLFGGNFSDTADQQAPGMPNGSNANTLAGVAITGNAATAAEGVWQYSTDGGTHWTSIPAGGLGDGNAIVLSASSDLRFVPAANYNGVPGDLTVHLIDSSNVVVSGTTTGADLASGNIALTGVDVSGAHNGGTTAVSHATVDLGTSITAVNDAPVASGTAALGTTEDTTNPPGKTVGNLFGGNFDDSADQQHSGTNPTGSVHDTLAGVAITGNAATPNQGVYQYSTDGGATWTNIPTTGLGDNNALVLSSSAEIRFVPAANFNGVPGDLTTRLIDSSNVVVTGTTTGHDLSTTDTAIAGVDVSGVNHGGTTAVSAGTVVLNTSVQAVNDAPIASGGAKLAPPTEDSTDPTGATVTSLLGQRGVHYSDSTDTVTTAVSGGSVGTPAAGIAITGNSATPDQGVYQYSTDGGAHWTTIPSSGLGDTHAIVIPATAEIRFLPDANFNGVPGELTGHVSDGTNLPSTGAHDISGAIGGTGGFSVGTITIGTSVKAVNDAPVASGSAKLPPPAEDTTNPPGTSITSVLGQGTVHYSDSTDTVTTAVSGGSVGTPAAGIAITGNGATPDQGVYQYSTDGGTHWTTIPSSGLSDTHAIVIPVTAEIRFVPDANFNGTPGELTAHVSDGTHLPTTGAHNISGAIGGTGGFSAGTITIGTSVTPVNDAPVASGSASLPPTESNATNPPGETIGDLYGSHFNDGADQQRTPGNPDGSNANGLAGIAITGNAATPGQGVYQYSTDGGAHWISIPTTGLGEGNAIILPASAELRFFPTSTFHGTPGALSSHLIDTSAGSIAGVETGVNITAVGGITPYSADTVQLTTVVTEAGGIPILTPPTPVNVGDPTGTNPNSTDHQFPDDLSPAGNEGQGFTDDFLARPIIPQLDLIGSVGNRFIIAEQHAVIAVPTNLFEDSYPGAQLEYDASNPAGGALPGWLYFDSRNLTFTGTPPASAHGAVDVVITARDQFGHEAKASFRILVGRDDDAIQTMIARKTHGASDQAVPVGTHHRHTAPRHHATKPPAHDNQHADAAHEAPSGTVDGLFASLARPPVTVLGRAAFSAQIRDAGVMGRLSQARSLLEAIEEVTPVKSAA